MPRRREVPKRNILPDPKFGSQEVSKFVNVLMTGGKKSVAESILYGALAQVEQKSGKNPLEVFTTAISNLRPVPLPPGRGRLVTRDRGTEVVQVAWSEPTL